MRPDPTTRSGRCISTPGRILGLMTALMISMALLGCDEDVTYIDDDPPTVPAGVFSVTGDEVVSVYWNDLYDLDLIGYAVYRHDGNDPVYGAYLWQGDVAWDENFDDQTLLHWYDDENVVNGETYYYAVLSFDEAGNESSLSFETVVDTPRPSGIDMELYDRNGPNPDFSGFDFSRLEAGRLAWNAPTADIYVAYEEGIPFVYVARPGIVQIQDYGTIPLSLVDYAPDSGYSASGRVELIEGHSYILKITENPGTDVHYAKFYAYDVMPGSALIDWAYQEDNFNPELKVQPEREPGSARNDEIVRF